MGRPLKYVTADDLLDNCELKDECFLWPKSSTPMPVLSPNAPMAKEFGTTSVMRILFTICRYIPAGPRLVRWCNSPFCVNPYHHAESKVYRAQRARLENPNGLLPEQIGRRHLIAPPDELLEKLRPTNPHHIRVLMDSAALAGFDAKGIHDRRSYRVAQAAAPRYAEPDKPVLVLKKKPTPLEQEEAKHYADPPQEEIDDDIFSLLERRDAFLRTQAQESERDPE